MRLQRERAQAWAGGESRVVTVAETSKSVEPPDCVTVTATLSLCGRDCDRDGGGPQSLENCGALRLLHSDRVTATATVWLTSLSR